jgi:hypothetical protein
LPPPSPLPRGSSGATRGWLSTSATSEPSHARTPPCGWSWRIGRLLVFHHPSCNCCSARTS